MPNLDQTLHGLQGQWTGGVSPFALGMAAADWGLHLANAPFHRAELVRAGAAALVAAAAASAGADPVAPAANDHRFADPRWQRLPFHAWQQAFLLAERWVETTTAGLPGVAPANQRIVRFAARQLMDVVSPSNLPWANPEIVERTLSERGANLVAGWSNLLADLAAGGAATGEPELVVGRDLAVTPGKVVFRDRLLELIQYAPATATVHPEPVLIVPAWIMKYYILDLSPQNSLVRHLIEAGHTVFCISWRNPDAAMRDVGFDDYRLSVVAAIDAVAEISGGAQATSAQAPSAEAPGAEAPGAGDRAAPTIHAAGYCLGGTLLAVTAAALARDGDRRLASLTLFATQTDFTEAGELQLFITEDQVAFLEDVMATQGYLDGRQMGGAFQLLRSRDLVWSRLVRRYWLGEQEHPNDLMTWNADATRMPARMHSDYLRHFFLRDDLAEGRLVAGGAPVALSDVHLPFFVVGTETDHVAPWRSVHKLHLLTPGEITFVLTSGGHNAGIVSEPGHPNRHFRIHRRAAEGAYLDPDRWLAAAELRQGSWWPAWTEWLASHSGPEIPAPASPGSAAHPPLAEAPGGYVLER